ncbi:carbonic anhydrase [Actinacidiphila alni]|uniref:carbonic anhydrase n=1 Tax=Actinacidiphila alni TaxID=380248 RepID=A0A1I2L917_9ACTN|nr:carbonic anhydrase [Actinacidiphila alni]SFF75804.1 carbonic anhydrase [Actinacidiphila alni]
MTGFTRLLEHNEHFASTDARERVPAIPFLPNRQVYVLTCIDPRVDPSSILELDLGDAIVARTVGGRANPSFLEDLAWICYLHRTKTPDADWFEIVVIHHTDCGSGLMADDDLRAGFVADGHDDQVLLDTAVTDPHLTVPVDVRRILDAPFLPDAVTVSGYAYDVTTGRLSLVTPAATRGLQPARSS